MKQVSCFIPFISFHVDRENDGSGTLERSKKESYDVYKEIIETNGESLIAEWEKEKNA